MSPATLIVAGSVQVTLPAASETAILPVPAPDVIWAVAVVVFAVAVIFAALLILLPPIVKSCVAV
ncbi:hypothetical protein D3C87_2098540 [compost metagenome]